MATIVPRWEWRTFGTHFGVAETRFAELTSGAVQESDELYFLGGHGANVKVRDGHMDIKVLQEVGADGLERWEPVMKKAFPLPAADAAKVFALVHLAAPQLARDTYTLDQFVGEVAMPSSVLRPVRVHKRRVRYTVGGCISEFSDVRADGKATRTIAIEAEDAAAVVLAVASVGLSGYLNMNYGSGLQALLDDAPERYAVIDVGTNSVKFHVGERGAGGTWRTIVDRAEVARLGEGLEKKREITPGATERTASAITTMVDEAKRNAVRAIVAVGTAGLRSARNSAAVLEAIRKRTGVSIQVISADEEGRLAYLAVKAELRVPEGSVVVFDTGGGSTQFTFGRGARLDERFSIEVGAVRYTERFGLAGVVVPDVLRGALAAIAADLSRIDGHRPPDALVAMGGAVTNIAAVKHGLTTYDRNIVHGTVLDRAEIDRQIEMYRSRDAAQRRSIVGLQPKRADVILAGACIVRTVMAKLGQGSLIVSDRGLRHGLLVERFGN
jgi:exopolyphosphatase/guanosine-5'-triphosphate,3'-diphosphate pyrophosphatase